MSQKRKSTVLILGIFALLFLLGQWLFVPKTYVQSRVVTALQAPVVLMRSLGNQSKLVSQLQQMQLENQSLRAQLLEAQMRPEFVEGERVRYVRARVYSSYPLNNADTLLINAGANAGIEPGMTVLAAPGIFLGEVTEVEETTSQVRTIFDPEWELQVKIGTRSADSLFVGGAEPRLTLISKSKRVSGQQPVYLADSRYPLGLVLGAVGQLNDTEQNLFEEATLVMPYIRSEINDVYVQL